MYFLKLNMDKFAFRFITVGTDIQLYEVEDLKSDASRQG